MARRERLHKIGEDCSERLDIVPAQLRVIVTLRPKYACRTCTDGVVQAPAPAHLVTGGLPTEATIAHVLVSKYADHLPLYRQSQIRARNGLELHRAVLAGWVRQGRLPSGPDPGAHGPGAEALDQTVHGRDYRAAPRSRTRKHQNRLSLGTGPR